MFQGEHSAILLTFIKLPFVFKIFVLSIFEWPLKTGFIVLIPYAQVPLINTYADVTSGLGLIFGLSLHLYPYFIVYSSSTGSGVSLCKYEL